jgi:GH3 auxin-responsive promoter
MLKIHTMKQLLNDIISPVLRSRIKKTEYFRDHPLKTQDEVFRNLIKSGSDTSFGREHGFAGIKNAADFALNVPVRRYEDFFQYIERCLKGEGNVLWNTPIRHFSKSSGTTNAQSKFIPISRESLHGCHFKAAYDLVTVYLSNHRDSRMFAGKSLRLGGSLQKDGGTGAKCGDLSAILMSNTPKWADMCSTPPRNTALLADWNEKLPRMAEEVSRADVTTLAGVPSWMLVLLNKVLEVTEKDDITQVWPNLELFMHGGINFAPYKQLYEKVIPSDKMRYYETYNASEGFFAFQDTPHSKDMLLLTDHGVFYEFVPMAELDRESPRALTLGEVETGVNYAVVISTNGGLWRYMIGDTVRFVSKDPYRIVITGRTKQFINAFGEELIVENADTALGEACSATGAVIREYTAGPVFMGQEEKGAHEWIIEFAVAPSDMETFTDVLDEGLKKLNSDYRAKRYIDITLRRPIVHAAPDGLFYRWMGSRGKLGGQNKVPRLANSRDYLDGLLGMM